MVVVVADNCWPPEDLATVVFSSMLVLLLLFVEISDSLTGAVILVYLAVTVLLS